MQLSIEIQTNAVSTWRGSNFTSAKGKRYGRFPVLVRFTDNGVVKDLGTGASGLLGIKIDGEEEYLAVAHPWEKVGSGAKTFYVFDLNLNTNEVEESFGAEPAPKVLAALLEIRYQFGIVDDRAATINYEIGNAVNSGDVPPAVSGQPAWPLPSAVIGAVEDAADALAAVESKIPVAEKGVNNGVATLGGTGKVPLTQLPDSSEGGRGVIRQASEAETIAGEDTEKAVHPAGLAAKLAVSGPLDAFVVSGAGSETTNGEYVRDGNSGARASYSTGANTAIWNGGRWEIYDAALGDVSYYSFDDVAYPWLVTTWETEAADGPAPAVMQSVGTLSQALSERAAMVDLDYAVAILEAAISAKANDSDVLKLSGTQTAAGSKTFSGRVALTGQPVAAALAANDAVSRDLSILEWAFTPMISTTSFAAASNGTGASAAINSTGFAGPGNAFMTSSGASASYGRLVCDGLGCRGGSSVPLNRSWYCCIDWGTTAMSTNTDFLFLFGCTTTPTTALASRGLQARLNSTLGNTSVEIGIHNGSSLTTAIGTILTMGSPTTRHWVFRWDSSTNTLSLYTADAAGSTGLGRASLIASVTQAPGGTAAAGSAFAAMLYATGTPAGTSGLTLNGISYLDK